MGAWTVTTVPAEDAQRALVLSDGTYAVAVFARTLTTSTLAEIVPNPLDRD